MPIRQVEIVIPGNEEALCRELLDTESVVHFWQNHSESSGYLLKVMVDATQSEAFLDRAEQMLSSKEGYRITVMSVDATLPRIDAEEPVTEKQEDDEDSLLTGLRVSREELYTEISDSTRLTRVYMALVVFSTIVAALGTLRDNTAVVIGAMVIAPLLGPNVGLSLSTTLADFRLGLDSIKTNLAGLITSLAISILLGLFMEVDPTVYNIASRTEVHLSDISLALASGAAGVLAYTMGMSTAVIGVMVAVALLPPLVTCGLLIGDAQWALAWYSFLLLVTNVICVNLAGVATFILQGVRPRTWYESEKAKRINKYALTIWIVLLVMLAVTIYHT
ncbi:MAG: TIGR00341 family protein [Balneolaceae bacterium]